MTQLQQLELAQNSTGESLRMFVAGFIAAGTTERLRTSVGGVVVSMQHTGPDTWEVGCGASVERFSNRFEAADRYWYQVERQHGWYDYERGQLRDDFDQTTAWWIGWHEAEEFADRYAEACAVDAAQENEYWERAMR